MEAISPTHLETHLRYLTQDIGVRLAGSELEKRAAEYVADQFRQAGAEVSIEKFPVRQRVVEWEELTIHLGDYWMSFPCSLFSSTPGTKGKPIEAPLVFFEAPAEYQRRDLSHLKGKAVVHLGCHIESRDAYRRLMEAEPAFLLFVDIRYPGTEPLADGMFPSYARSLGAVPTVNVAYMDAWRWKIEGADAAQLCVTGGMVDSVSQNVIADLPGSYGSRGVLLVGAHHDTQAESVGADDNGSGTITLVELARVLANVKRRRGIRLISFGAGEQLSVGSAEYVRSHRREVMDSGRLMFNLDSFGSPMGWTELVCNGPAELADHLGNAFADAGHCVKVTGDIVPYADHFPFVAAGVPGVWLGRHNCTAGRFFHHRPDDDMTRVSPELMATIGDTVATTVFDLANTAELPFPHTIGEDQNTRVQYFWEDLFGGWE